MKKKHKVKYIIAIYSIITSISIVLWIIAFNRAEDIYQATLLNLATEVFGVVLIFFIVNYLFALDDWELSERVNDLLAKLESDKTISADKFFHNRPNIGTLIKESKKIDLCGGVLAATIDSNLIHLKDALTKGANIRILIMELNEVNLKTIGDREYKNRLKSSDYYLKKHESAMYNIKSLFEYSKKSKGTLDAGVLPFIPLYGIKSFIKNRNQSKCLIEIYGFRTKFDSWPNFTLEKKSDKKWHDYFNEQFEIMWSKKINIF